MTGQAGVLAPWCGIGLVSGVLVALLVGLHAWREHSAPNPELLRKSLHIGMGLTALTFPWLFDRTWPLVLLAFGTWGLLLCLRSCGPLHRSVGGVIHGVTRTSRGDLCFPAGLLAAFIISEGDPVTYTPPVLILALADPAAALIGMRRGRHYYQFGAGEKSVEGSLAFFAVAFLATASVLSFLGRSADAEVLAISGALALVLTLVEAVSNGGSDNVTIPVAGTLLLGALPSMPAPILTVCFALAIAALTWLCGMGWVTAHTPTHRYGSETNRSYQ